MPDMVNVRKAHAGTDSAGHTWPTDGAVIEVPVEHALILVRIPDGGFAVAGANEPVVPTEAVVPADVQRSPKVSRAPRVQDAAISTKRA